jgi:NAD+ diphosphatase
VTLERLALSRSTLDRAAHRRVEPDLLGSLLADPKTAVLVLDGDHAPVRDDGGVLHLALLTPDKARSVVVAASEVRWGGRTKPQDALPQPYLGAFLGEDDAGRAHVVLAIPGRPPVGPVPSPQPSDSDDLAVPAPEGTRWAGLRELGDVLDDTDAGIITCAVALGHWHAVHERCSRCGAHTDVTGAGWSRQCPDCGTEHYPRTDPAVIMAVVDEDDRILLGRQSRWPEKRFSTLAGFVEPGESLEAAVRREVFEESGIVVSDVHYRGSQPWPFPSSLMLGFVARATSTEVTVDGDELAQARWWSREELGIDVATQELLLPPPVSIARKLIEEWYGGPINDGGGVWR